MVGRVANSEPFCWSRPIWNGGTRPDDWPNDTHMPSGFRQSSEPGKVSLPTEVVDHVDAGAAR